MQPYRRRVMSVTTRTGWVMRGGCATAATGDGIAMFRDTGARVDRGENLEFQECKGGQRMVNQDCIWLQQRSRTWRLKKGERAS